MQVGGVQMVEMRQGKRKEGRRRHIAASLTYLDAIFEEMKVHASAQRVPARPRHVAVYVPELLHCRKRPHFADRVLVAHILTFLPVLLPGRADGQRVAVLQPVFHFFLHRM